MAAEKLDLTQLAEELLAREPVLGRAHPTAVAADQATTSDFTAVDADGREVTRTLFRAQAGGDEVTGTTSQAQVKLVGEDVAVLSYLFEGSAGRTRNTTVWVVQDGHWRAAHHQQTRVS